MLDNERALPIDPRLEELRKAQEEPRGLQARDIWPGALAHAEEMRQQAIGGQQLQVRYGQCDPLY